MPGWRFCAVAVLILAAAAYLLSYARPTPCFSRRLSFDGARGGRI